MNKLLKHESVKRIILLALDEDVKFGDVTSKSTIKSDKKIEAKLMSKEKGVIAGLDIIPLIINMARKKKYIKHPIKVKFLAKDGDVVKNKKYLAVFSGDIKDILILERTLLNFLSRMSGVATTTFNVVESLKKSKAKIYDTRKTIPGFRYLDKYSVLCGGGRNHRLDMSDQVLIKDNHWETNRLGVSKYLKTCKKLKKIVEVEIDNFKDLYLEEVLNADIIMLDNFNIRDLQKAIKYIRKEEKKLKKKIDIEVSGNVSKDYVKKIKDLEIDRISMGKITHSALSLDISLEMND